MFLLSCENTKNVSSSACTIVTENNVVRSQFVYHCWSSGMGRLHPPTLAYGILYHQHTRIVLSKHFHKVEHSKSEQFELIKGVRNVCSFWEARVFYIKLSLSIAKTEFCLPYIYIHWSLKYAHGHCTVIHVQFNNIMFYLDVCMWMCVYIIAWC